MDRTQRRLVGLLALQLVLLAIVHWPFARARSSGGEKLLAALASVTPGRIEIVGGEGSSVTLERRAGAWVLGAPAGYPLVAGKAEKLIQDLEHLTAGRPVASARGSHAALKVAGDQFERRLRIWASASKAPAAELFVGSSAGSGGSHVRVGGSDRVFEASGLSAYDIPAEAGSWIERDLVSVRAEDVSGLEVANRKGSFALANQGGGWRVRMPAARAGAMLDSSKVIELVRSLCGLSIDQPIGRVDERAQGLSDPEATVRLATKAAGPGSSGAAPAEVTIRIGAPVPGKDSRYVTCSRNDFAVTVPKYSFDRALSVELKELVKK
jgi:hypothetical protein